MERLEEEVSPDAFWKDYIQKLKPCLIGNWLTDSWSSRKDWFKEGRIDVDFLMEKYGHLQVPVTNCSTEEFKCSSMLFREYLRYLQERRKNTSEEILYCKDWHLALIDKTFYEWPEHFRKDWLNEYCLKTDFSDSDYRFVYIGVKDTKTPLHRDVLASHSWSSNVGKGFSFFRKKNADFSWQETLALLERPFPRETAWNILY